MPKPRMKLKAVPKFFDLRNSNILTGNAKFNDEQIQQIKFLRESGMFYKDIAEQFGCHKKTIERIFTGQHYA